MDSDPVGRGATYRKGLNSGAGAIVPGACKIAVGRILKNAGQGRLGLHLHSHWVDVPGLVAKGLSVKTLRVINADLWQKLRRVLEAKSYVLLHDAWEN